MADYSINAIIKAVDEFTKPVRAIIGTAEQFGKTAKKVGQNLSAYVSAPLIGLGFLAVTTFSDFQAGMSNISTLVDTATESMSEMSREVLAISTRVPTAVSDLTSSLYDVRSAGISAGDAMKVLEGSSRLAVAGLGSSKEAVDLVTSSINAFNLEGEEQARIYDVIFKTVKNGKTNISQLAQGFGAVAGTVANAGIKIDEYLASIAAMTTTGLPAAQAHTQIRAAIAGMTRETELSSAVLKKLGAKTFKDLIAQSGGMVPAFARISDVLGGNDAAMIKLFGSVEAYNAVISLTKGQNEAYVATLDDMRNGSNEVDRAFSKQAKTFKNSMAIYSNQIGRMQTIIGESLAPAVLAVGNYIGKLADWFSELSPKTQKIIIMFAGIASAAGPVLVGLGLVAMAIAAISLPVIAVVAGIAALGAALGAAVIYWDDLKGMATGALDAISSAASSAYKIIKPLIDAIGWMIKYSPAGLAYMGGKALVGMFSGGGDAASPGVGARAGATAAGAGTPQKVGGEMVVKFDNAPPGFRVESSKSTPGMLFDADVGYNMAAPQ